MSGMPVPAAAPLTPVAGPQVVQPRPKKPDHWGHWFLMILTILPIGAGIYAWRAKKPARNTAALPAIRTASITSGPIEKTLRLTGVTAAANYVSLITPRLRGSRSDHNRDLSTSSTAAAASTSPASSSSSATSTGTSSAPNASAAFTAATSRLGSSSTAPAPATSTSTAPAAATSTAMGPSGLGTTSDELPPTVGAGGASNDFLLVLQDVAPAGTMVRKGDQVAEFDRQYMLLRLDDYRASVFQSEAMLKSRKANLEISHKSHDQLVLAAKGALDKARLDLKTIPVLSDIDADKARLAFQQAEAKSQQLAQDPSSASEQADTRNSELDLDEAKLELTRAEKNSDQMLAKAPIDGLVVMETTWRGGDFGQIQRGDQLWPASSTCR